VPTPGIELAVSQRGEMLKACLRPLHHCDPYYLQIKVA
jgi:hypothetical protein